jgi:hypothetical protein
MQLSMFLKGSVVGAVSALTVLATGSALAGSGVGGVFNLGQTNTVNAKSTLSGNVNAAQLGVVNTSTATGATGLAITTATDRPPFKVSSPTVVPNLNASWLRGFGPAGLGRIAMGIGGVTFETSTTEEQAAVLITVPQQGFVRLDGRLSAYGGCTICRISVTIYDQTNGTNASYAFGAVRSSLDQETIPISYVFPAAPGTHKYTLNTGVSTQPSDAKVRFQNVVLIAQFLPFGATGSQTSLNGSP